MTATDVDILYSCGFQFGGYIWRYKTIAAAVDDAEGDIAYWGITHLNPIVEVAIRHWAMTASLH